MASKKGLLSRIMGRQVGGSCCSSSCCGVRIEEIPHAIDVEGIQVGILGLEEAIEEVKRLRLENEEQMKRELLDRVNRRNYIPAGREEAYREALWREYLLEVSGGGEKA